jgi:hypothetical protein
LGADVITKFDPPGLAFFRDPDDNVLALASQKMPDG